MQPPFSLTRLLKQCDIPRNGEEFIYEECAARICFRSCMSVSVSRTCACAPRRVGGLRRGPSAHHDGNREGVPIHPAAPAHHSGSERRPGCRHRMVRGNDGAEPFGSLRLEWKETETG